MEHKTQDTNNNRWLIFLSLFLIILGQILLYATPIDDTVVLPPAMLVTIAGIVLFSVALLFPNLSLLLKLPSRWMPGKTQAWTISALTLSILATIAMVNFEQRSLVNYIPIVTLWVFSGLCYVGGFVNSSLSKQQIIDWLKNHKNEIIQISLVTLLAMALRFYKLGDIPLVVNGDEARIAMTSITSYSPTQANPFSLWENIGSLYMHAINLGIFWLGTTPLGLRILPAIGGTLAVPAIYLLARQIGGHRIAIIAAILITFTHTHLHFSRTLAVSYIQGTWLGPLEFYFLLSGLQKRSSWRTALGGVLLAMHTSVYITSQIIAGIVVVYMLVAWVILRPWFRSVQKQALVFWGGFLIPALPGITYFLTHPEEFFNRLNADGTFQSGWLSNEIILTGQNAAQILATRIVHSFLSLIYYPAIDFYGSPAPVLSLVSSSLFLVGLAIVLWKTRSDAMLLLNGYFWGGTMAIALFSVPPSADTYRMLIAVPPALIMVAIGLDKLLDLFGIDWQNNRQRYIISVAAILASLFIFNMWTYFFEFAGQCRYGGDPQTRFASYLGNYARTVKRESDIFLLSDDVFVYGSHDSVDFLSGKKKIINVPEPIDTLTAISGEIIIANPRRVEELENWVRTRPGGELHYVYDCKNIILLAYQLP